MNKQSTPAFVRLAIVAALSVSVSACNAFDRASHIGAPPDHEAIGNYLPGQDASLVNTPQPVPRAGDEVTQANSLWHPGSRAFFRDQRAGRVGDILTVNISITDSANLKNETTATRATDESVGFPKLFGLEKPLERILPGKVDLSTAGKANSASNNAGTGEIKRNENIDLKVAAMIMQKLPNGNFVIKGNQEVLVNNEMRQLDIGGIIRPEDIGSDNTISYEKIAQARISYGGKGTLSDVQQPRYGEQLFDIISPF